MRKSAVTKNGVTVYSYENAGISSFTISLFVRYGVMHEGEKENGLAHFLEHSVFRNINKMMGGTLYETLDRYGLYFNAATYPSHIEFTVTGATKHFGTAAEIITLALSPLVITKAERDLEARRIKAEIREEDEGSLAVFADSIVYAGTPLSRPIAGKCSDIDRLRLGLLKAERPEILSRENIFFFVSGAFPENAVNDLCEMIERADISSAKPRSNAPVIPNSFKNRNCACAVRTSPTTSVSVSFDIDRGGYTVPELFYLCDLIFAGESCPMYRVMSEDTGTVYSYDESLACYDNFAVLSVAFDIKADKLEQGLALFFGMLSDACASISDRIPLIMPSYTDNAARILDDSESIVSAFGYQDLFLGLGAPSLEARIERFSNIDPERIGRLARETFTPSGLVIAIKGNKKRISADTIRKIAFEKLT